MYRKHRHFYRLAGRHGSPPGYLFKCDRCVKENLYPFMFVRVSSYWK